MEKADLGADANQRKGDSGLHPQLGVNPGFSHRTTSCKPSAAHPGAPASQS